MSNFAIYIMEKPLERRVKLITLLYRKLQQNFLCYKVLEQQLSLAQKREKNNFRKNFLKNLDAIFLCSSLIFRFG